MFNTGIIYKSKQFIDGLKYNEINYVPKTIRVPERLVTSRSHAWFGLEKVIWDIIEFSKIETDKALEFGVEYGYSSAVFANYFKKVTGVDIFTGDPHAGYNENLYELAVENLKGFKNIDLIKADYKDFIKSNDDSFDLVHVDIIHAYEDTYACGLWGAEHSDCTLFHDTQSFPDVKRAVSDIAKKTKRKFYNYRKCNGLGILIKS